MTDIELLEKVLAKHGFDDEFLRNEHETTVEFAARFIDVAAPFIFSMGTLNSLCFGNDLESSRTASEWRSGDLRC